MRLPLRRSTAASLRSPAAENGTAAHVERLVRKYRLVERLEEAQRANALHVSRYVHYGYDEDGSVTIRAKLPPEIGALVRNALDAAIGALEKRQDESTPVETESRVSAGTPRLTDDSPTAEEEPFTVNHRFGAKRADALALLALLAQSFLARDSDEAGSISGVSAGTSGCRSARSRGPRQTQRRTPPR